jgi:aryl-alcohol dehydrogenase-like predicted oxidoreductase
MTKIDGRTKKAAAAQIDQSLARLLTDRLDLLQFHELIRDDDPDLIFADGGAFEAATEAKAAGKIRYLGFTGHKTPEIHVRTIELAKQRGVVFDTVQMPLNVMDAHFRSFEKHVLPLALELDMGILGMKTFGDHFILESGVLGPIELLHYSLNLPTSVVITGIDSQKILEQAVEAATTFRPLSPERVAAMLAKSAALAADGSTELYKTSHFYDGTVQNPHWLG